MRRLPAVILTCLAVMASIGVPSSVASQPPVDDFPYPTVPDSLTTVEGRIDYVVNHYWDNYDFRDTTAVKSGSTELGFVNFVDLLSQIDSVYTVQGVQRFAHLTRPGVPARERLMELADRYLGDPESPVRNDLLYALFLERTTAFPGVDIATRMRADYKIEMLRKNSPGMTATDFSLTQHDGTTMRLSDIKADYTLLLFHDPECDNCHRVTDRLVKERRLFDERLKVVAVYPETEREKWDKATSLFPIDWIDAWNTDGTVTADELYYLPALPVIYLLDKDKKVIIKDPTPEQLIQVLHSIL